MASEDVTIKRHTGKVADLEEEMCGIDDTAHAFTGVKHFHYKDIDGNTHQLPNLDEKARFTDLEVTGTLTVPSTIQTIFYVSPTGNDTTGDGTSGTPYATVEKCMSLVPHVIPDDVSILIKVANGTYNSFPTCIDNYIPNGQILIDGYEGDVDVLAGPYTISSISKEEVGSTFTVSGASFTDDGLRDADNNPVYIKMLTGTRTGNVYPVHKNGTDWITVLDKNLGLADGDTFKIVRPGVRVVTSSEIVIAPKCDRGFASIGLYNISFISSYEPDASHNAAVKISGGNVCMHLVTIRSDATKSYALAVNSTSINGVGLFDDTKLSYYSSVTGTKFDPFYFGFCFHANAMTAAAFKSGVSVAVTPGGKSAGGSYETTNVSGLCTRTEVTAQGESVGVTFSALGRVHVQQGSTRADIRACIMNPFGAYAVLVSDNTVAVCAYLKMIHTTALGQLFKVEDGSVLNDLTSIATDTSEDYVVSVGANCQLNLLAVPSITGDVDDIYFERGQIEKSWPAVGGSVTDYENSFVAVAGSTAASGYSIESFIQSGIIRAGNFYQYVAEYQQDLAVSETFSIANPTVPSLFSANEAGTMHIMLSGTVRGTNEAVMFTGYEIAALDGEKINNLTAVHDSITGQYGITSVAASTGSLVGVSAGVTSTGGVTDAITIDWRLFVQGAVHQGVGAWC